MRAIITSILLLGTITVSAQDHGHMKNKKRPPLEFAFYPGVHIMQTSNLNAMLKDAGAGEVSKFGVNATVSLSYRFGKTLIGISGTPATSFKEENRVRSSDLLFHVSTNAIRSGNLIISPQLGIGYQGTEFTLDKKGAATEFNDYLTVASNQTRMEHDATIADFNITQKKTNTEQSYFMPKFRIGYKTSVSAKAWEIRNADVVNAPKDRIGLFYAQLAMGIGW